MRKTITKRAIVEFVVAELKIFPIDKGFHKACENYVRLELKISEAAELNSKLKNFCDHTTKLYRKNRKYYKWIS